MNNAAGIAVVVDRLVLGRAIIPNGDVAGTPAPANGVLLECGVALQQLEDLAAVMDRKADEALEEMTEHERAAAGLGMHAHRRMLGFVNR